MTWIDWLLVGLMLGLVAGIAIYTQRFVKGVADFLAAGRVAGRYVLAVSGGEAAMGLISMVAIWEMYYKVGFAVEFWQNLTTPIGLMLMVTGYCIYRFRETRALTMGQMLEIRYSRRFRIFAGCLSTVWFSIGGTRDLISMFRRLNAHHADTADDGSVRDGVSAVDLLQAEDSKGKLEIP